MYILYRFDSRCNEALSSILFGWCNTCLSFQTFVISLKSLEEQAFLRKDFVQTFLEKYVFVARKSL